MLTIFLIAASILIVVITILFIYMLLIAHGIKRFLKNVPKDIAKYMIMSLPPLTRWFYKKFYDKDKL